MTTYGPSTLTLAERLRGADLVARVVRAELVHTTVDELSESRREHGTFVLEIAETLRGQATEKVEVLVARGPDEAWPVPDGEFLALLQGGGDRPWVLVHNSAFPLRKGEVHVDPSAGLSPQKAKPERLPLDAVTKELAEQDERVAAEAKALEERETSQFEARERPSQEMPGDGLREWLDLEHGEGGRAGTPLDASDADGDPGR